MKISKGKKFKFILNSLIIKIIHINLLNTNNRTKISSIIMNKTIFNPNNFIINKDSKITLNLINQLINKIIKIINISIKIKIFNLKMITIITT